MFEYPTGTHRVTQAGPHTFGYDGNGAMTTRTISGVTQTLDYDKAHRLTTIAGGGDTTGFLYDADGNQVRSTANGIHTFQWGDWTWTPGDDPEMVYRFAGALVATRDGDGKLWWSIDDHLSSTTVQYHAGTDTVRHQRYLPFGKVRIDDGVTTDVGYTGQRLDTTGLMFYQARYYDPLIGRFTSADTIVPDPANPQDLNRYTYVRSNPLKYTDPTGHAIEEYCEQACGYAGYWSYTFGRHWETLSWRGGAQGAKARWEKDHSTIETALTDYMITGAGGFSTTVGTLVDVKFIEPVDGVWTIAHADETVWGSGVHHSTVEFPGISPKLQSEYAARVAKHVSRYAGTASIVLAFVADQSEIRRGAEEGGVLGIVVEIGETSAGIAGGFAGTLLAAKIGCKLGGWGCLVFGAAGAAVGVFGTQKVYNWSYDQPWE